MVVSLAGSLIGCSATVEGIPEPATATTDAARPAPAVAWKPCDAGDNFPAGAQCGSLSVPVDYSRPEAATAKLALIRFPATGAKIGSLVINPGGPGESGVSAAADLLDALPQQIRQKFDLVGFDPPGVRPCPGGPDPGRR